MREATVAVYMKVKRDLTLDILRGYFLFVIIINHLGSFPSLFEPFTGGGRLLVSAAEGFFFLSGLLVGRLRGNDIRQGRVHKANAWLVQRATMLYIVSVSLTLGFTAAAWYFDYTPRVTLGVSTAGWLETILKTLTFQYSFGLADMLPLYAVYMLVSIGAFKWLAKGRWRSVLLVSGLVWLASYLAPGFARPIATYFSATSWQLLFFSGMVLGYHNDAVQGWWSSLGKRARLQILSALSALAFIGIGFSWVLRLVDGLYGDIKYVVEPTFDTIKLGPGRVLLFAVCIIVAYHGIKHFEAAVSRWVGWSFIPLGQQSLFVYAVHSIIVFPFIAFPVMDQFWSASFLGAVVIALVFLLTIAYSRLPAKYRIL